MLFKHKRIKNRILQAMYRPKQPGRSLFSGDALGFLDELEQRIEEKVAPIIDDLFN